MTVREWKFEDILRIAALEEECFKGEAWSYRTLASCYESPAFYGVAAEENGEIVGYGGITVAADNCDLENVLVAESHRRSGLGYRIVTELMRVAQQRGAEKAFLEVRVSNTPAIKTYFKAGFHGAYARTRYYADGEDCLVMSKNL